MRTRRAALLLALLLALGSAAAHATLVFGDVTLEPDPPAPGAPLTLHLELEDPSEVPVQDALVRVEARPAPPPGSEAPPTGDDAPEPAASSESLEETEPGRYQGRLVLPEAGRWTLTFRDRTFRQEEATASITVEAGEDVPAQGSVSFVFPPTETGQGLGAWLLWLVGVPLLAGVVVTVWVLQRPIDADEAGDEDR